MDYDDKLYYEYDDAVIMYDRETGEPYTINPAGNICWVNA